MRFKDPDRKVLWGSPTHLRVFSRPEEVCCYTAWETTVPLLEWKHYLGLAGKVLAISQFCAIALGAEAIVPLGIKPLPTVSVEKPERFVFGSVGNFSSRKGFDLLYKAFAGICEGRDMELWLKSEPDRTLPGPWDEHPQVKVFSEDWDETRLSIFYGSLGCYIQASRGEGFGLCPQEAASLGVPSLVTDGSGLAEQIDDKMVFGVPAKKVPSVLGGEWWEADVSELADSMLRFWGGEVRMRTVKVRMLKETARLLREAVT